jgi:hypothetical protein
MKTKLSLSVDPEDIRYLDERFAGHPGGRSGAFHEAVRILREADLEKEYDIAFAEFEDSGDAALWDQTSGDGIDDETG